MPKTRRLCSRGVGQTDGRTDRSQHRLISVHRCIRWRGAQWKYWCDIWAVVFDVQWLQTLLVACASAVLFDVSVFCWDGGRCELCRRRVASIVFLVGAQQVSTWHVLSGPHSSTQLPSVSDCTQRTHNHAVYQFNVIVSSRRREDTRYIVWCNLQWFKAERSHFNDLTDIWHHK